MNLREELDMIYEAHSICSDVVEQLKREYDNIRFKFKINFLMLNQEICPCKNVEITASREGENIYTGEFWASEIVGLGNVEIHSRIKQVVDKDINFVDWRTVPEDTKVFVSNDGVKWINAHFCMYIEDSEPYLVYEDGTTSFTAEDTESFRYCKLWN